MPEGHTIHRLARRHRADLAGRRVGTGSPQGRFTAGAARLDGLRLDTVDAHGKHLFYRWEDGAVLHVHLGLFGKFRTFRSVPPPPTDGTRLTFETEDVTVYLAGPTVCDLVTPDEEAAIRSRLGPDPLRDPAAGGDFAANLARRRIPVGAAILDQKVLAGLGNVYRAEVLFLAGIDPLRPADSIAATESARVWELSVDQLRRGARSGRIVTVDPVEVGARTRRELPRSERLYVYGRAGLPCRRCGTPIRSTELGGRPMSWCASCQS